MLCRMLSGRLIATPNVPAGTAKSKVHPSAARLQALLAALRTRLHPFEGGCVGTSLAHVDTSVADSPKIAFNTCRVNRVSLGLRFADNRAVTSCNIQPLPSGSLNEA
jgi:hypothetical protein